MIKLRSFFLGIAGTRQMPFAHAAKIALAALVAWSICAAFVTDQAPVFAGIAAVMVVQPSVAATLSRAVERSLGVILGVVVASGVALVSDIGSIAVILTIVASVMLAWVLRLSATSSVQVPISAMLVLSFSASMSGYEVHRIVETIVGAAIGIAINAIPMRRAKSLSRTPTVP
jgi:uncharacterized membrane protein YgaE (UPF0421/DUF939 family)